MRGCEWAGPVIRTSDCPLFHLSDIPMSVDGISGTELQDMMQRDETDHAPLLAATDASPDYDDEAGDDGPASELKYSGGWFIWSLTFSAGISGLLFGYEYVLPIL